MYGLKDLKPTLKIDENSVECPVKGCSRKVERQRISFKKEQKYQCPVHNIYISKSTFEYESENDNLLWTDTADRLLYNEILKVKRESRIARDNSEDALTWNVMRFLDKQNLLPEFLSKVSKKVILKAELILWSYSKNEAEMFPKENSGWSLLNNARKEFGEIVSRGSEPDIIILTDKVLYFIEAKLQMNNRSTPSDLSNKKNYETGGANLFQQIFKSKCDFNTIAINEKQYELMRFWLLGSWIAKQLGLSFKFYGLVMNSRDKQLESEFGNHIIETSERKFSRMTWEQIYKFIQSTPDSKEKQVMTDYFINKTVGYNSSNKLVKAFDI